MRRLLLAGLFGWLGGVVASSPAIMVIGWRDSEQNLKLFLATTGFGLLAWALWTLLLGFAAWLVVALPIAMLVRPAVLVHYRIAVLALTILATLVVVSLRMHGFQDLAASRFLLRFALYMPYAAFAFFFAFVTAWWYLRGFGAAALD